MVKPFAVRCRPAELMALRVLLGSNCSGRILMEQHEASILQIIVKFMGAAFDDLDLAVREALRPDCDGVVNVLHNVTLVVTMVGLAVTVPPRRFLRVRSSCTQHCVRIMINDNVILRSFPDVSVFGLGKGVELRVENVRFEFSFGRCHPQAIWRAPCFVAATVDNRSSTVIDIAEDLAGPGCAGCIKVLDQPARLCRSFCYLVILAARHQAPPVLGSSTSL